MRAVAEGVEDPGLRPQLEALGCDAAQGFGISRPLPEIDATRLLVGSQQFAPIDELVGIAA